MIFKNLDKCGLNKDFEGNLSFTNRILNPSENSKKSIAAFATSQSLKNKEKLENNNKEYTLNTNETKSKRRKYKVESGMYDFGSSGIQGMQGVAVGSLTPYLRILDGIISENDWTTKRKIFADIYCYDLAGAVVDLISNLPYSNFNLIGIDDPSIVNGYLEAIDQLPMQDLLPAITTDYLVNGAFVGSLNWDDTKNKFTCLMPHDLDYCDIYNIDLFGFEPIIDLQLNEEISKVLNKNDPRIERIKEKLPSYIKDSLGGGKIELNPLTTMYIPRRGKSTDTIGSSYFNRIITIHLVEKALIKGTIETAQRRQRAIMHIQAGIQDEWEPTNEELNELANYFLAADLDPISGIVVTRNGVNISDVRPGHDLWAWDDLFDFAVKAKLNALGVNESILSGDASWNTLESSLSSFMDNISTVRDTITNNVFYKKIFPIIAYKNGYFSDTTNQTVTANYKNNRIKVLSNNKVIGYSNTKYTNLYEIDDLSKYQIPNIQYVKNLKPKADKDYMDILNQLEEKGIPISMRMFAAAGGENIDDLISTIDDDNDMKLEIAEKKKDLVLEAQEDGIERYLGIENLEELLPNQYQDTFAKIKNYAKVNQGVVDTKNKFRDLKNLDEKYGVREYDSEGHRRILSVKDKKSLENKIHKQMALTLAKTIK